MRFAVFFPCAAVVLAGACTTFSPVRPLAPGTHAVAVTGGGPLANVPGVGTIPLPHVTVEGRHGVVERADVHYGVHLLPLVFGVAGVHVGGAYQMNEQPEPFGPAITVGQRFFGFTNVIDPRKGRIDVWGLSQSDFTASWNVFGDHIVYAGLTGYVPLNEPKLYLAPFAGTQIVPGVDFLRVQLEARWLAPYVDQRFAVVDWVSPGDQGGILLNAGVAVLFGDGGGQ